MTDERGRFLHAINLDPADDAPRLIFADWLDEQGEELRARYIRVRVEWDRLPECGHDWATLPGGWKCPTCRRKDELYAANCNGDGFPPWEHDLREWAKPLDRSQVTFRRGFPAEITLPAADFLRHAGALFGAAPIERVVLSDREPSSVRRGLAPLPSEGWYDWNGPQFSGRSALPQELFGLLSWGEHSPPPDDRCAKGYDTPQDALDDLSRAAILLGRLKAGLPPLPGRPGAATTSPEAAEGRGRGSGRPVTSRSQEGV